MFCTCCNVTTLPHHGGAEGWSAARQRAQEAESDGGRGASVPVQHAQAEKAKGGTGNLNRDTK
jgi:hypothetical protein